MDRNLYIGTDTFKKKVICKLHYRFLDLHIKAGHWQRKKLAIARHPTMVSQNTNTGIRQPTKNNCYRIQPVKRTPDKQNEHKQGEKFKCQSSAILKVANFAKITPIFLFSRKNNIFTIFFRWSLSWSCQRQNDNAVTFIASTMLHYQIKTELNKDTPEKTLLYTNRQPKTDNANR